MYTMRTQQVGDTSAKQRQIQILRPEQVDSWWSECEEYIASALEHADGELTVEDVYGFLQTGAMTLAVYTEPVVEGFDTLILAFVLEIATFPRKKVLRVVALGGRNLKECCAVSLPPLEDLAIYLGCSAIEAWTYGSVARMVARYGFEPKYVVIRKDLSRRLH